MRVRACPDHPGLGSCVIHGVTLREGDVELATGDEDVGDAEVAVHDGHLGRQVTEAGAVGTVQEVMETGLEVRVAMDEQAGLLVGGGAGRCGGCGRPCPGCCAARGQRGPP
jgi:hypothetical protein